VILNDSKYRYITLFSITFKRVNPNELLHEYLVEYEQLDLIRDTIPSSNLQINTQEYKTRF